MPSTIVNHSKEIGAFSNFPPKKEYNSFMSHQELYQYVTEYAKSKELLNHIKFNTDVKGVKRSEDYEKTGKWTVRVQDRITKETTTDVYDGVLVCVGHLNRPKIPYYPGQHLFKRKLIHTHSLKGVEPYRNKKVVVVGMGCSGLDAAVETSKVAKRLTYFRFETTPGLFMVGPRNFETCIDDDGNT
ncbi:Dimethylaniline monooxygenase [N-oxide-forming] 4 [Araneus ventricosus]|uniref:Flavin-containing monooxygenase n=1 Tax=Araneus ventricosus TaxID=182803 RepID=A0A4Y2KVR3_ARAVE|nr:Dimethylaniline monooxygenase [N-oxide-forming] 4 [Araneus ventricosus]